MMQKLGKYAIVEKLGQGSMGAVYKAYDSVLGRYVAIKTMSDDIKWNPELKLRFYREARSAANVHHPNIVTIHDLGEEGKITYIVMELLEGFDLKSIIADRKPISLEQKLSIMIQIADALNHAHLHGIIHRDIKPGNIHVGSGGNVKILDFGIARIPSSDITRVGARLGTPVYMSPEQVRGDEYDARSDQFSTGIVFYELITYVHPFRDKNIAKSLDNILSQTHFSFDQQFPEAPEGLWPIINTCLAKDPKGRYGTMAELARACRNLLTNLTISAQRMRKELETAATALGRAADSAGCSRRIIDLAQEVRSVLGKEENADYLTLVRLSAAVNEEHPSTPSGSFAPAGVAPGKTEPPSKTAPISSARGQETAAPELPGVPGSAGAPAPISPVPHSPASPESAEAERQRRGRELVQKAEELLKQEQHAAALEHLRTAIGLLGPEDNLVRMMAAARRHIEDRKRERISRLLEQARTALSTGSFEPAIEFLGEVLELEPEKPEALEMRRQALSEIERAKKRLAVKEQGEREKTEGFKLLAKKQYRESLRTLQHSAELLGEDPAVQLGIDEAQEAIRAGELHKRSRSELAQALQLFRAEQLDDARAHANRVLELTPKNSLANVLLHRIDQAEQRRRQREAVIALAGRAEQALAQKDYNEAGILAREALSLDPSDEQVRELSGRIEAEKEQAKRQEEVAKLFSKVQDGLARQEFDQAETLVRQVLVLKPEEPRVAAYLKQIHQAREEKQRAQEISLLIAEAEQSLARGQMEQSQGLVDRVLGTDPGNRTAEELGARIRQARQDAETRKLQAVFDQANAALGRGDFPTAANLVRNALQLKPQNTQALALLSAIETARQKHKQAEISDFLSRCRDALARGEFDQAVELARMVLTAEPKHMEAKALIKEIDRARRAKGKESQEENSDETGDLPPPADLDETAPMDGTYIMPQRNRSTLRTIGVLTATAVVVFAGLLGLRYWKGHSRPLAPSDLAGQLAMAKSNLDQKRYPEAVQLAESILAAAPGNGRAQAIITEARNQLRQSTIDSLMVEAQNLRSENRLDESNQAIQKVLNIDPAYQPALAVRSQIEAEIAASKSREEQDSEIQTWLAGAESLIAAGKLAEAKREADKIQQLRPDAPELPALLKKLSVRMAKQARSQREQQEAEQRNQRIEDLGNKAEDLFRRGKYADLQPVLEQLLAEAPQNGRARTLHTQASQALASLKQCEAALAAKEYDSALSAVARLEKANPADPNIIELRRRAESSKAAAKAAFTVYRLADAGTLTFDDQPIGTNGEVENKVVGVGRHKLAVRSSSGKQTSLELELLDGQNLTFVYDVANMELRQMTAMDQEALSTRKQREETHQFALEHTHGFLKGKCAGELVVNGFAAEFKPADGDHHFSFAVAKTKLSVKEDKLEFIGSAGGKPIQFKAADARQATSIRKLWENLTKLAK